MAERPELGAFGTSRTPLSRASDLLSGQGDRFVRWGGVALVAAGVLGLVGSALFVAILLRTPGVPFAYTPLYGVASFMQYFPRWALICAGLIGLCFLLDRAPKPARKTALAGAALSSLPIVFSLAMLLVWLLGDLLGTTSPYGTSSPPPEAFFTVVFTCAPVTGVVLSGVAAFWARGLGRWRFALPVVGVMSSPLLGFLVFSIYPLDPLSAMSTDTRLPEMVLEALTALANAGWLLLGYLLYGAKDREAALIAKERRVLGEKNGNLARRLYEEAFGAGDLAVVDEILAPDFFDRRRERRGPEEFKRTIADLRRAFPDLSLRVEDQHAEGDAVTTRCVLSGTDRGGVLWYPPTGRRATFSGTYVDRFSGGGLVEHGGESDTASLLDQLGLPTDGK